MLGLNIISARTPISSQPMTWAIHR